MVIMDMTKKVVDIVLLPDKAMTDRVIGINAELTAPSPIIRLIKLGILNATTKACINLPVPKKLAISISRIKPRILLVVIKFKEDKHWII